MVDTEDIMPPRSNVVTIIILNTGEIFFIGVLHILFYKNS
jgi:hypothetical protein